MSVPAMSFGDIFWFSRNGGTGGGEWVYPKGADSMAVFGVSFGNTLVGSGSVTSVLCTNALRKQSLFCMAPNCQLRAMTIAIVSLMSGGGLSHCIEDGCKSTCVKSGANACID